MRPLGTALLFLLVPAAHAAGWRPVTTGLLGRERPGFGGLSGVAVDHATGHVFVQLSDRGVFRSADGGKTWERHGREMKGHTEAGGCFQIDPTGKTRRLLLPTVYGGPVAVGAADAAGWRPLDEASAHVDWCAADWTDPDLKFLLALKHESGGSLLISRDAGKSFAEAGKGYGPGWVFDAGTAGVPAGGRVRADGPAAVARRGAVLARRRGADPHDEQG